jgi:predicted ATPase
MNEQLIVKNFGPIKDATVDFKRVTVFIGPTGGGKSTLAKLKDIFLYKRNYYSDGTDRDNARLNSFQAYKDHSLSNFFTKTTFFNYSSSALDVVFKEQKHNVLLRNSEKSLAAQSEDLTALLEQAKTIDEFEVLRQALLRRVASIIDGTSLENPNRHINWNHLKFIEAPYPWYCPSERIFVSALEYSWAGLIRDDIGLPKGILDFANNFSNSRKTVTELYIPFLDVDYVHQNGQDFIKVPGVETIFRLYETASGIQSVTPLLVLLEHLSRNTEQAQSFIIEEPELNLYPTAQQGLLNWLVEKCTKGENDLTLTTHSPYILSHLNLLLYAYQVAHDHPDRAEEVAEVVPRASWINPKEFACYQVENGGVTSLVSEDLGLIDDNGLDGLSGDAADAFDNLIRLSKAVTRK